MSIESIRQAFLCPGDEYSPLPFWFWNDELTEEEITRQIRDFRDKGVAGFVIHPRKGLPKTIPYLSDRFMHFVRHAAEEAARLNMRVVLYDEAMYPSGSAHGMVVMENPAYASRCLVMRICHENVPAADDIVAVCEAALSADGKQADDIRVLMPEGGVYQAREGRALLCFSLVYSGGTIRGVHKEEDDGERFAPASADLLNPEAVQAFIRLTHERYYEVLGEHFGKTVIAMFTDEPDIVGRNALPGGLAWTEGFLADFKAQGCAAADLPALWLDVGDCTEEIRRRYRRAVNTRMNRTYYGQLAAWCGAHGVALTGHPAKGYDIGLLRPFQLPGQDVVWRFVGPENGLHGEESVLAKCASDAARHLGRQRNANECFGCCGPDGVQWAFSMDDMKWYMDWLFVRGTNLLYPHAFFYSIRDGRGNERPPDVGPNNLWWPWYRKIATYMRRLSWLMTDSVNQARVAILCDEDRLPWESCIPLYQNQIEFNYLERSLLDSCVRDGDALCIAAQRYTHIIDGEAHLDELPRDAVITPAAPDLRVSHVVKEGLDFYLLVNEGETEINGLLQISAKGGAHWLNAWTGGITPASIDTEGRYALCLPRRESLILCVDPAAAAVPSCELAQKQPAARTPLAGVRWGVTPMSGNHAAFSLTADSEGRLPDWAALPGLAGYSGWMAYETALCLERPALLQLGEVRGMTRMLIDGQETGMRMWSPHAYVLPAGRHSMRIEVCNTFANAYENKPLPSGLMGPVQLEASSEWALRRHMRVETGCVK